MSYRYLLYGLNVESEIEVEEAYSKDFEGKADVEIVAGHMPPEVLDIFDVKDQNEPCSAISGSALAFRIPRVGDYLVRRDVITASPMDGAAKETVKSFLLGSAFGYCMFLRKQVLLHGGAVAFVNSTDGSKILHDAGDIKPADGGEFIDYGATGIIITGDSGAGKSTVSDALMERGYKFIADDVCAVTVHDGIPHINMAYPQKKLCRDAALKHSYDLSELIYIGEDRDKYAVRLSEGFLPEGADFKYLFELVVDDDQTEGAEKVLGKEPYAGCYDDKTTQITVREITGHEKLKVVLRNIYRGEDDFKLWGISPEYMQECLKIASAVRIYRIVRPREIDTLKAVLKAIEEI